MAPLSRRHFIRTAVGLGVVATLSTACPRRTPTTFVTVFKRSGRGRRISNAAKIHNANFLYTTSGAALANPAHPGDNSKIVSLVISRARFNMLFPMGVDTVDLRKV